MNKENNRILNFEHNGIMLSFYVEKDNHIVLLYVGQRKEVRIPSKNKRFFRSFIEIDTSEDNRNLHYGNKHIESAYGLTYKYVSHHEHKNKLGDELIIKTRNEYLEVDTHFQFYNSIYGISSFNEVKNISSDKVTLKSVSSFVNIGFSTANNKNLILHQADNSWHCEAQWKKDTFKHLGIYNGNDYLSNKRYIVSNAGSWSTKEHLPMIGIENKKTKDFTLLQIESNGSWGLEIADTANHLYYMAMGPEFIDHAWKKVLLPNESFISCQATAVFEKTFENVIKEITKIRRAYRRFAKDNQELPVIFNDYMHALWDKQTTEDILPLVDIAGDVGSEVFCMDAGWFAKGTDWWDIVGEWKEYEPNFPNGGLKAVCDYIRNKNMIPGIWFEPEAVGMNSKFGQNLPDDYFFIVDGKRAVTKKRYMLNYANPHVYEMMLKTVSDAVKKYQLGYLKFDYNTDIGLGNESNADSLGDGLLKHNRAFIKWLNELMDMFPDLTIENCASGGCRMDSEILKVCPIQSTSDQTSFKKYPYLSANVLTAATPEQAAVWSYPVNAYIKNYMPTDEEVVMNMCNAMLGRIHLASYINKLPNKQLDLIKEGIEYYKAIRKDKNKSLPIFPKGTALFGDKEVVGGIEYKDKYVLGVWNTSNKCKTVKVDLTKYNVSDVKVAYPSKLDTSYSYDKTSSILTVDFKTKYGARIFELLKRN